MTSMFGHRWTGSFGESTDPDGVWGKALAGVTPRQIADGLNAVLQGGYDWPPSAPEFRKLCLGVQAKTEAYNGIHRQLGRPAHLLPRTTSAEDKAKSKLVGIAAMTALKHNLGNKNVNTATTRRSEQAASESQSDEHVSEKSERRTEGRTQTNLSSTGA